jgi:hypothetical protein
MGAAVVLREQLYVLVMLAPLISRIEDGCPLDMALRWVFVKAPRRLPRGAIQKGAERPGVAPRGVQAWSQWESRCGL